MVGRITLQKEASVGSRIQELLDSLSPEAKAQALRDLGVTTRNISVSAKLVRKGEKYREDGESVAKEDSITVDNLSFSRFHKGNRPGVYVIGSAFPTDVTPGR